MKHVFPFGSPLMKVEQQDKSPKKVFVLGDYSNSVHAKWIDANGNVKTEALPVASEPHNFCNGEEVKKIIRKINFPPELGRLVPADENINGPLSDVLDKSFLMPLGFKRKDAWLCDFLPYPRINQIQQKLIKTHYNPLLKSFGLPECSIPVLNEDEFNNPVRVDEIVAEIEQSKADTILLLGDVPISYFLSHFAKYKKLTDFGDSPSKYGIARNRIIAGKTYKVIPLLHPRQSSTMGITNVYWDDYHMTWYFRKGRLLLKKYNKFLKEFEARHGL